MIKAENQTTEEKSSKGSKLVWIIVLLVYLVGVVVFSHFSYPRTTINGVDRGVHSLDGLFEKELKTSPVKFTGKNGASVSLSPKDIDLSYKKLSVEGEEQNPWAWPVEIFQPHPYIVKYQESYDREGLEAILENSDLPLDGPAPEDAHLEVTPEGVKIEKEEVGNKVDKKDLTHMILTVLRGDRDDTDLTGAYLTPKVTSDDPELQAQKENLEKLLQKKVVFDFEDRTYSFDREEMVKRLKKDPKKGLVLNKDALADYVAGLAQLTDTYGKSRHFQTTGMGEVEVKGGIYGWQMDQESTTTRLKESLEKGGEQVITPVYNQIAQRRTEDDIGNSYVEIDLSRQHLWIYQNGNLVLDTDVVTGNPAVGRATPTGVSMVWAKVTDTVLKGTSANGAPYASPVSYWMPIDRSGDGLHDANWRSAFGGQIYRGNGSNGCINLPPSIAEDVFDHVEVGTPVVVYESTTNFSEGRSNGVR